MIALDFLELPVKVTQFRGEPTACPLWMAVKPVADLYTVATTPSHGQSPEVARQLVVPGESILLVEYTADEVDSLPGNAQVVDPQRIGGAKLAFLWLDYRHRQFGLWFLEKDNVERALSRRLRLGLLRLHAEHQVLKQALSLLSKGIIQYVPRSDTGNAFEEYLNHATRILSRQNHAGFSQAAIREVIAAYELVVNPEERSLLTEKLEQAKRQIRLKVESYTKPVSRPAGGPGGASSGAFLERGDVVQIFVSYCHQDTKYIQPGSLSLLDFLSGLTRERFDFWNDERISTSEPWDDRIRDEIVRADIALVLVSQPFLNSRYCQDVEVTRSLEEQRSRGLKIYPVILSPCDWKSHPWLVSTQFQPRQGTIETTFKDVGKRKDLFLKILQELRALGQEIRARR